MIPDIRRYLRSTNSSQDNEVTLTQNYPLGNLIDIEDSSLNMDTLDQIKSQLDDLKNLVESLASSVSHNAKQINTIANQSLNITTDTGAQTLNQYSPVMTQSTPLVINQVNPPIFNGDEGTARSWLNEYQTLMTINGYNDKQLILRCRAYLKGRAADWYDVTDFTSLDWRGYKTRFLGDFCGSDSYSMAVQRLDEARLAKNEKPLQYYIRILKLCNDVDRSMSDSEKIRRFAKGLDNLTYNSLLAAKFQKEWTLNWLRETLRDMRITKAETKDYKQLTSKNSSDWICFNCNDKGHSIRDCKMPRDDAKISKNREQYAKNQSQSLVIKELELDQIDDESLEVKACFDNKLPAVSIKKPLLTLSINDIEIIGRMDSGSDLTVLSEKHIQDLKITDIKPWKYGPVTTVEGSMIIRGVAPVIVTYNNLSKPIIAAIGPDVNKKPLWGLDLLNSFGLKYDFSNMEVCNLNVGTDTQTMHPLDKLELPRMNEKDTRILEDLVIKYADVFSISETDIGQANIIKHRIILSDNIPIQLQTYRVPIRKRELMETEIKKKEESKALRKSISQYSSPAFLVDKDKGKSCRLVADYRALNAKTVIDRMPMPHPEDVFTLLSGCNIFAKLDMTAMFNQIQVEEQDIEKTAITTPFGLYECPLMPFGLVNAPATAVRLMREVLRDLDCKTCFVYFDDIMVFANGFEELIERCRDILERLRKNNLKLKPSKCKFGLQRVEFLGHVVSERGIDIDPSRIDTVVNYPTPKTNSAVRRFYGLCNYMRKFIKNFSAIARPLTKLLPAKAEFYWNDETQDAFVKLKEILTTAPVLTHFDPNAYHELRTDASSHAIGAILYQKHADPKNNGVITYYSKTLNTAEINLSATERELLAAYKAVTDLKHYLIGKEFTLVTDHSALSLLRNHKDPHHKLARWAAELFSFEFKVVYKKGSQHVDADALSRMNQSEEMDRKLEQYSSIVNEISAIAINNEEDSAPNSTYCPINMMQEQRADFFCSKFIEILENDELSESDKLRLAKNYTIQEKLLYKIHLDDVFLLVIPTNLIPTVLAACHDVPLAGHLGFRRMLCFIKSRYTWKHMRRDVKRYVSSCDKCQRRKMRNKRKEGLTQPLPIANEPFDIVGMDLIVKLPVTGAGYNCILVCTDNLTKFVVAEPLRNESAESVIHGFFKSVVARFGCPRVVISDRGSNLRTKSAQDFFNLYGIKRHYTSAYHPQSNGQTERFNRTLATALTTYVSRNQKDWADYVPGVVFAYNITQHSVTNVSPFELIYKFKPRIPLDNHLDRNEFIDPTRPAGLNCPIALEELRERIFRSQQANKKRLDANLAESSFKPGDIVVFERPTRLSGQVEKLTYIYTGPYKIVEKLGDVTYLIEARKGSTDKVVKRVAHACSLKHYDDSRQNMMEPRILADFVPKEPALNDELMEETLASQDRSMEQAEEDDYESLDELCIITNP